MKLILSSQNSICVRMTQSEFKVLNDKGFVSKDFGLQRGIKLQVRKDLSLKAKELLHYSDCGREGNLEIRVSEAGLRALQNPSKEGIETVIDTDGASLSVCLEVDLKH